MTMNRDGRELTEDRISQLPQNVIHDILTKLPLKDAARTALVSRQWRRHWRTIPQLVFDDGFERITDEHSAANMLMIMKVYKSLLPHDGPVNIFVLAVPGLTPCEEIDHIVHHVSGRGVQEFTLEFSSDHDAYYRVPSSLFTALQLRVLKLKGCLLMAPPWFVRFSELTRLVLTEVRLRSDFFEQFLPKCPFLERLALYDCEGIKEMKLKAPRLQQLYFVGHLLKMCFEGAPLLLELGLNVYSLQKPDIVALFAYIPLLRKLDVGSEFLKVLGVGGRIRGSLHTLLHSLQIINVGNHTFGGMEDEVLACLILSSPYLHTLTIELGDSMLDRKEHNLVTGIGRLLEAKGGSGQCLQHLRVVELVDSFGTPLELELVRFILATAPRLLRVLITPSTRLCSRKIIKLMKEALRYKRVSEAAEIVVDWNDDDDEEEE